MNPSDDMASQAPTAQSQGGNTMPPAVAVAPQTPDPSATGPAAAQPAPLAATPMAAEDADLIEPAWIAKAKEIIATTRQDPYQQSRQLAALKADYLSKRYNKEIKLSD